MSQTYQIQYFLGANSPQGFYSLYDQLLSPETANAIYIIKGGPGCGKSTLMRQVAAQAAQAGETAEYILCSGDPDSLDGVVLPRLKAALVDGTAPHVIEPKYPAWWSSTSTWAIAMTGRGSRRCGRNSRAA